MSTTTDRRSFDVWRYQLPLPEADARLRIKRFETLGAAQAERDHRIGILGRGNREQRRFARKLERCRKGRRCKLSICTMCQRRTRLWLIGQIVALMAKDKVLFITIIPDKSSFKTGSLADAHPRRLLDRVRKQLTRCGIRGLVVGAVDGTHEADRGEYQVHIHALAGTSDRGALDSLRSYYPPTPTGSAAVVIQPVAATDLASAAGYCFKTYWVERVRYRARSGKRSSKMRRLAADQEREWLAWQAGHPPESLLFLYGLRRRGDALCRLEDTPGSETQPGCPASRCAQ
ncbi:hypothetical protein [Acidisphaera sp. S103]|uniref:hypothetical protein n=1 Tax=Acidisphaera sp. S103 TaxID=1747223 RepID=UPI00131EB7C5|nr:hypothetical protein [Acidisphaera sp. S103]